MAIRIDAQELLDVLRLTPPLIITTAEIEQALAVLEEVLA